MARAPRPLVLAWPAVLFLSVGSANCGYDFDAAFTEDPLYPRPQDGGSGDVSHETGDAETDSGGEGGSETCVPSCEGKCAGADDGCGDTCPEDNCAGACCDTTCCPDEHVCDDDGECCPPATCATLNLECGKHEDGCGGELDCGQCSVGPCESGQCTGCPYGACSGQCCDEGQVCDQTGTCCSPTNCAMLGMGCGMHDDGCGNPLDCGICGRNEYCIGDETCVPLIFKLRDVPAGSFTMGSPASEPGRDEYKGYNDNLDEQAHSVTLTRDFEISNVEIPQADFEAIMGYQPSYFVNCGGACPVENLTWDEAAGFCNELSYLKRLEPCFACTGSGSSIECELAPAYTSPYQCEGYRLPTEAEWEHAARAGTQSAFYSGELQYEACNDVDYHLDQIGWYVANAQVSYSEAVDVECSGNQIPIGTHLVRERAANAFDLYDMAGNVWEWVFECGASYSSGPDVDPVGPLSCAHRYRLYRGGSAGNLAAYCRHAERANSTPLSGKNVDIGFRPARTLP